MKESYEAVPYSVFRQQGDNLPFPAISDSLGLLHMNDKFSLSVRVRSGIMPIRIITLNFLLAVFTRTSLSNRAKFYIRGNYLKGLQVIKTN